MAVLLQIINTEPLRTVVFLAAILGFVSFNAAYLVLLERKGAAWIQRRLGPMEVGWHGILQPLPDMIKMICKQIITPNAIDGILFRIAPIIVMIPAMMGLVAMPFSESLAARNINLGAMMILSFGSINVLALMMGGWASRNKYAVLASARIVAQNVAYEVPMFLVLIALTMHTHTYDLSEIVKQQAGGFWHWNLLRLDINPMMPIAFVIFFTCMLAETNRAPFDMVEAESELIAGSFTEYSSISFGLFFMAEYANIVLGCGLITVLFLGGWQCPFGMFPGVHWFLIKLYALVWTVIWVRWTFPRTQFYNLLNLSWKVLIPFALMNLITTGFMVKLWQP